MKHRHTTKRAVAIASAALFSATLMPVAAIAGQGVTVYFTRHAEKMTELMQTAPGKFMEICTQDREDCAEVLNPVGELRAKLLADYFDRRNITVRLTNVFSSDKQRTRQTVAEIAERTGLSNDTDQMSGDGVQQLPADVNDEFSSNSISVQPTVDALLSLPPGSVAVVAAHSGTIYRIFGGQDTDGSGGLGIDTTQNSRDFPKGSDGKVPDFGDLWKVVIRNGHGRLKKRVQLVIDKLRVESH